MSEHSIGDLTVNPCRLALTEPSLICPFALGAVSLTNVSLVYFGSLDIAAHDEVPLDRNRK